MKLHPSKHAKRRFKRRGLSEKQIAHAILYGRMVKMPGVRGRFKRMIKHKNITVILIGKKVVTAYESS